MTALLTWGTRLNRSKLDDSDPSVVCPAAVLARRRHSGLRQEEGEKEVSALKCATYATRASGRHTISAMITLRPLVQTDRPDWCGCKGAERMAHIRVRKQCVGCIWPSWSRIKKGTWGSQDASCTPSRYTKASKRAKRQSDEREILRCIFFFQHSEAFAVSSCFHDFFWAGLLCMAPV